MRCSAVGLIIILYSAPTWAADFQFRTQEIDKSLKVGYAILLEDLNKDGRKDIIVVDTHRVVWFENPTWNMRTIIEGQTKPDNVCVAAQDIDGDGRLDLALGAGWRGLNSKDDGTLQWLRQGESLDEPWSIYPIGELPSVHRIQFADTDGDGKGELLVAPLLGPGATFRNNFSEAPVSLTAYKIPPNPMRNRWPTEVIDGSLHVMHNFFPVNLDEDAGPEILTASYEGVSLLDRSPAGGWTRRLLHEGNQENPKRRTGASEIKLGRLAKNRPFIATIEPWHGHQVVAYTSFVSTRLFSVSINSNSASGLTRWNRTVIDDQLRWGHAVSCADLNNDGQDELIIGVRDNMNKEYQSGVRVYKARPVENGKLTWHRQMVDPGGVAVEDMAVADLNDDGRPDIVAVGRATRNIKVYWNEPKEK